MDNTRIIYPSEGHNRSGMKEFVTRLPGAQFLGEYISKNITGSGDKSGSNIKKISSIVFEKIQGANNLLLLLGYEEGFDIWDFKDGLNTNGIEILVSNKTEFPTRGIRIFGKWTQRCCSKNQYKWQGRFAVSTSDKDNNMIVRCFCLEEESVKDIGVLRFPSRVYSLLGNEKLLIVGVSNHIFGFAADTLNEVFSLSCFPNHPRNDSVMSLGTRWLAYPSDRLTNLPTSSREGRRDDDTVDVVKAAQAAMSGLFWLGRKSTKVAGEYIQQRQQSQLNGVDYSVRVGSNSDQNIPIDDHGATAALESYENTVKLMSESSGIVAVLDVVEGRVIEQVKAYPNEPLTCLSWSPCGSILATASASGQTLHIYGMSRACDLEARNRQHRSIAEGISESSKSVPPPTLLLRYKLVRGITPSSIRHLTISSDNLWCVATTSRRTSHIFAIDPQGGPIDGHKHTPHLEESVQFLVAKAEKAATDLALHLEDDEVDNDFDFVNDSKFEEPSTVNVRAVTKIYSVGAPVHEKPPDSSLPPRYPESQVPVDISNKSCLSQQSQDWAGRDAFSCYVVGRCVLLATADAKCARHRLLMSIETNASLSTPSSASSSPSTTQSASPSTASPLTSFQLKLNTVIGRDRPGAARLVVSVKDPDVWDVTPTVRNEATQHIKDKSSSNAPPLAKTEGIDNRKSTNSISGQAEQQAWLRQIERKTRPSPRAPIWMSPHVSFSSSHSRGRCNSLMFEHEPVIRVVSRKETPLASTGIPSVVDTGSFDDGLQFSLNDE